MTSNRKQPLNITINGNDLNGPESNEKNNNQYENYIIKTNKELHKTNKELENKIIEIENEKVTLEEELGNEEAKRIYMKGLMHNLNEIKKKSVKYSRKNEVIDSQYKEFFEDYKDILFKLSKYLSSDSTSFIISVYLIIPICLIFLNYVFNSFSLTIFIMFYLLVIFFVFAYYCELVFNKEKINQFEKYKQFEIETKKTNLENKNLMKEIEKIEKAIKDIDLIIDEC